MSLSSISIKRPVLTIVMNLLIMLFGLIGAFYLGVREYPSIDPPIINVRTSYTGANADVIESQITEPLEKAMNSIQGIRSISSSSNTGSSQITIEFEINEDLEAAANDVRDKVSQTVRLLPQDIDAAPVVQKSDANADAILSMVVQSDNKSILALSDYAENVLAERLQTIKGVSNIQIWGQKRYAMRIWLDPARLASYRLTALDVKQAIDKENIELPSGRIEGNNTELTVNTVGRLTTPEQFNEVILVESNDRTVKLKDVGYAILGPENEETVLRQAGTPMIGLALIPQPGANYLEIADEFYKRYDQFKKTLPKDFKISIALDNTQFVRKSVTEVRETILIALGLVVIIIFLFFRDWTIAFRPLIDIPVSLTGAFFIMYVMGYSINVLTLLAIVLATGLVVDDGIVVTEIIYKKVEAGMNPVQAAFKGSQEIIFAVISTSITLAAVFMPVIFMKGFVGRLFQEFGVVLAGSVLISAFVSLSLTPMLNAYLIRKNNKKTAFYTWSEPFFERMENGYKNSLTGFMKARWLTFPIIASCFLLIYFLMKNLNSELAPLDDRNFMRLVSTAPEGASFDFMDNYMLKLNDFLLDSVPENNVVLTVTSPGFNGSGAANTGFVRLMLKDPSQRKRSQLEIANYITAKTKAFPEARTYIIQQQTISTGGFGGLPIQYVLKAQNFDKLKEFLPKFEAAARVNPIFSTVDVNLKFNKPELNVKIDREKAKNLEVNVQDVAQTIQFALSGLRYAYFIMNGKQYSVVGQVDRQNRDEPLDLKSLFVRNKRGDLVQLDNIVSVVESSSPPQLYHFDRFESATVSASLAPGRTIGEGIKAMDAIAASTLDDTFKTGLSGPSRDFAESSSNILFAFGLALLLVYLILSAQFESFVDPLVIMFTVPLALAGALFSLWFFNQTLNIFSEIGIIMLIGLVTKNGILIVEFANQLREQGQSKGEAILNAAQARLRPILMTSLATMLGALPIALALGAGSKSRMSMGIVIIGGLMFSLILTLFVIPAIYTFLSGQHKKRVEEQETPELKPSEEPALVPAH